MNDVDRKTLALTKVIQEMDFPREQLEATLSTFVLMRFNQDEEQAVRFLCKLQGRN